MSNNPAVTSEDLVSIIEMVEAAGLPPGDVQALLEMLIANSVQLDAAQRLAVEVAQLEGAVQGRIESLQTGFKSISEGVFDRGAQGLRAMPESRFNKMVQEANGENHNEQG